MEITGRPGAVAPADGVVLLAVNLDDASSEIEGPVAADGSFTLALPGELAHGYRLQARNEERSDPVDVTGTADGAPVAVLPVPSGECLTSFPPLELEFGDVPAGAPINVGSVTFANGCAGAVTLAAATLRKGLPAFLVMQAGQYPKTIEPGTQEVAEVGFKSLTPGLHEDILFVALETPDGPRRIVTVRGNIVP